MDTVAVLINNPILVSIYSALIMTCSPIILFAAFVISVFNYLHSLRNQTYANLDNLYLEHLKLAMQYPNFRNPEYTINYKERSTDENERLRYEIYAFNAWNMCETIYDRKLGYERKKWKRVIGKFPFSDSKYEAETWKPVIVEENKLHRKWFNDKENFHKFKEEFREYIQKEFPENTTVTKDVNIKYAETKDGSIKQVRNNS